MPVSTIPNRRSQGFDINLQLRDYTAAAISATTSGTAIPLVVSTHLEFKAVVNSAAYSSFAAGTAQWVVTIEASVNGSSSWVAIGSVVLDGTQKEFDIPLSGDWSEQLVPGALFIRATATKTGSPGNLTYGAYLSPSSEYC